MLDLPILRWGQPYESLETQDVVHYATGDVVARVGQANGGLVARDLKHAPRARRALKAIGARELLARCRRAADLFLHAELPLAPGGPRQSADEYARLQSVTTGLPEHLCRANMEKNAFVLTHMEGILEALTRGLDLEILARGHGEEGRQVTVSYQAQAPVLGAVLPSNSPGVHSLWLPTIPLLTGLVLKPGSSEPWTPYRLLAAYLAADVPAEAFGMYPGGHDVGGTILAQCRRAMIFGSERTVEQYAGNPRVQVHGPGFSKILLGDDVVDRWADYLEVMVESILSNAGRSCINASAIFASRHTREIAEALAERLGPIEALPLTDPQAQLAAFTSREMARGIWSLVTTDLSEAGVTDCTARFGSRLIEESRYAVLRPLIAHCNSTTARIASKEFMFPFASVVTCPQADMVRAIGPTLVATAITSDDSWIGELTDATNIDRLNLGPIPTNRLNWYQPHEGNLVEFLYRSRAYQIAPAR